MNEKNIIFGRRAVMEAIRSNAAIEELFLQKNAVGLSDIKNEAELFSIKTKEVAQNVIDNLASRQNHQGVLAKLKNMEFAYAAVEDIFEKAEQRNEKALIAILDEIVDPHNLGAIIRSAECAGFHGVIIPKHNSAEVNATVMKTSAGAASHIPIVQVTNLSRAMKELKAKGVWIHGTSLNAKKNYYELDADDHIAVVIGSEGNGMRRLTEEGCDFLIKIPIFGNIESLNASVAAGIVFFDIQRQRMSLLEPGKD
ncbi:23S rRNA (guanosine(2251)-2'-O)-methyltransferase RlmB [bacterium]|nr:23S rRNA (guanosine(2251)-2'-O)-methyltransferase RlmB [bacterium]